MKNNEKLTLRKLYKKYRMMFNVILSLPIVFVLVIFISNNLIAKNPFDQNMWATIVSGCLAFYGAALLGLLAFWQNERLNESNNEAQERLVEANQKIAEINEKLYNLNNEIRKENNQNLINAYTAEYRKQIHDEYRKKFEASLTKVVYSFNHYWYDLFKGGNILLRSAAELNDRMILKSFEDYTQANAEVLLLLAEKEQENSPVQEIFNNFNNFLNKIAEKRDSLRKLVADYIIESHKNEKDGKALLCKLPDAIIVQIDEYNLDWYKVLCQKAKLLNDAMINAVGDTLEQQYVNKEQMING